MLKEACRCVYPRHTRRVLILILMEHAQREIWKNWQKSRLSPCLNPYFNGTCSKSVGASDNTATALGLNPYFNGTCSKSENEATQFTHMLNGLNPYFNGTCSKRRVRNIWWPTSNVLILVLVEHAQRVSYKGKDAKSSFSVLILVLVEHAQRVC